MRRRELKLSSPHRTLFAMKSAISAELLPSLRCILERLKSKEKYRKKHSSSCSGERYRAEDSMFFQFYTSTSGRRAKLAKCIRNMRIKNRQREFLFAILVSKQKLGSRVAKQPCVLF